MVPASGKLWYVEDTRDDGLLVLNQYLVLINLSSREQPISYSPELSTYYSWYSCPISLEDVKDLSVVPVKASREAAIYSHTSE